MRWSEFHRAHVQVFSTARMIEPSVVYVNIPDMSPGDSRKLRIYRERQSLEQLLASEAIHLHKHGDGGPKNRRPSCSGMAPLMSKPSRTATFGRQRTR